MAFILKHVKMNPSSYKSAVYAECFGVLAPMERLAWISVRPSSFFFSFYVTFSLLHVTMNPSSYEKVK